MRDMLLKILSGLSLMYGGSGLYSNAPKALENVWGKPKIDLNPNFIEMMEMRQKGEQEAVKKFAELNSKIDYGMRNQLGEKAIDDWFDSQAREKIDPYLKSLSEKDPEFFKGSEGIPSKRITTDAIKRSFGETVLDAIKNPDGESAQYLYDNPDVQELMTDVASKTTQAMEEAKMEHKNLKRRAFVDEHGFSSGAELKEKNNLSFDDIYNRALTRIEKAQEHGKMLDEKKALRKEARQLSKNYRRGDFDLSTGKPIYKIDGEYLGNSTRSAQEIYKDLSEITDKTKNKYTDVKKMKQALRELKSIKGNHISVTPNREKILSEMQDFNPEMADKLKDIVGERKYIFPTDLEHLKLTPEDYKNLPATSHEMRYMGHETHYAPARQLRDQIKGTAVGRWLEWVAPDSTLTSRSRGFDALVDKGFSPFEKYMNKPNIAHNEVNEGLINSHYDAIEELLKNQSKDTFFEDQINEALNSPQKRQHLEAYLNNPDLYIGNPEEALTVKENFMFRRPAFEQMFPMLSNKEATEVGDAMMSLGKKMGISDPIEMLNFIREEPSLFLKELRAKAYNNPLARKTPYYISRYMNKNSNLKGLNLDAVHFEKPSDEFLARSFDYSGPLPNVVDYSALNNEIERGGLRSVGDIVDDFRELEGASDKYSDARSNMSDDFEDARSHTSDDFEDAMSDHGSEYGSDSGSSHSQIYENPEIAKAVGPLQKRMFPKSFDKFAGKALKVLGKAGDIGMLIDGAYVGSQNAVGYRDLIKEKGLIKGGWQGFKDQMGRAYNYANKMYEDLKSSSFFHKLNEYLPSLGYYESDNVHQDLEDRKQTGNIITDTKNKIMETGSNVKNLVTGGDNEGGNEENEFYGDNTFGLTSQDKNEPNDGSMAIDPGAMSMGITHRPQQQNAKSLQTTANPVITQAPSASQNLIMNPNRAAQL